MRRNRHRTYAGRLARESCDSAHAGESIERLGDSNRTDWLLLFGVFVVGILLGHWQNGARQAGRLDPVTGLVQRLVNPGATTVNGWAEGGSDFWAGVTSASLLKRRNEQLERQIAAFSIYAERERLMRQEIDQMRALANMPNFGKRRISAEIIGYFPFDNRITISAGRRRGVEDQLPVVTAQGLIGVISTVDEETSQVTLLTSPNLKVGALVTSSTPVAGLIKGETASRLVLDIVDNVTIAVGDKVVTSGYGKFTPRGVPIGEVIEVVPDPDYGTQKAFVFPYARVALSTEVVVLK